jgi:hypothetical protein
MDPMMIWAWSLVGGGVVSLIVVALLLAIIPTVRSIDHHAREIWQVGKNIVANTVSIWMLNRTNQIARKILTTAQSIDTTMSSLAEKLGKGIDGPEWVRSLRRFRPRDAYSGGVGLSRGRRLAGAKSPRSQLHGHALPRL